jgi:hypothetical protein
MSNKFYFYLNLIDLNNLKLFLFIPRNSISLSCYLEFIPDKIELPDISGIDTLVGSSRPLSG